MASLQITTKASTFKNTAPLAMGIFRDGDRNPIVALPEAKDRKVIWTVPDTAENRDLFRRNYEPSGLYGCKSIDVTNPEKFEVIAEADKPKGGSNVSG